MQIQIQPENIRRLRAGAAFANSEKSPSHSKNSMKSHILLFLLLANLANPTVAQTIQQARPQIQPAPGSASKSTGSPMTSSLARSNPTDRPLSLPGPDATPRIVGPRTIIEQGPHHRKWEYKTIQEIDGREELRTHSYEEVQSGMNVWLPTERRWVEATDEIELFRNGAIARKARHQAIFSALATDKNGTIDLQLPDGGRLRSRIMGIA